MAIIERNRLRALELRAQKARENGGRQSNSTTAESPAIQPPSLTSLPNPPHNGQSSATAGPASSSSDATSAPRQNVSTRRNKRFMNYYEYNFTEMVDTKGGFLVETTNEDITNDVEAQHAAKRAKLMEKQHVSDPPVQFPLSENPRCKDCDSMELDRIFQKFFHVNVCRNCRQSKPEKYSLLTKTECREDYLLTESELRDAEKLPTWEKPNPHKNTWSNMFLYLREQVEAFAWEKWGSEENLDREFARRESQKKAKKEQVFSQKLKELRKKTRTSTWAKNLTDTSRHEHVYEEDESSGKRACSICGLSVEMVVF
ncbi:DNA repair protein [Gonapodya prolifera JEL478]|uniref:DNA repair protein n=1 Tax=Gonapodya prolifera (strain JEL478) TaxID=1344416 RepID=A0A139AXB0_GONPJ|nr:DNA repair protein [Gonapodya prolifera JEL478]|eukprot:KXS21382.1 DNA repair protein [Gonapodya prolifera JEL478]